MSKQQSNLEWALSYAARGLKVFPLFYVLANGECSCRATKKPCTRKGKHPTTRNGVQDATSDEAQVRRWWTESPHANIGLATGHGGLIVMDIDDAGPKVGSKSLQLLIEQYGPLPETLCIKTGSGGKHYYFYSTHEINNSASKVGEDIDIRGYGGYVILPPSNHASGGKYEWINDGTPIADMPQWLEARCMGSKIDISKDEIQSEVLEDSKEKPNKLSADQLVRLLDFIPPDCERETWWQVGAALKKELGDKRGFQAWDEWSKKANDKYDPKIMPVQWESFTDKGISGGTIFHFAKTLGDFRGFDIEAADTESFKNNWCFIASIKRFVELDKLTEWDKEQFDAMHAPLFTRGRPSEHVLKNPHFKRVSGATYWPEKEQWVTEFGIDKLNYWKCSGVKAKPGSVDPFLEHVKYLYPDEMESQILLQYLAFQVQHPGEKIHWALLLEGDQGNGKSYFAAVMRLVLGPHNVKMVHNDQLHETFTQWQRNTQLVIVEEMMARQRLELMNKLKPMITEPWCTIREMYRPPYEQPNRFNFLFFSNHRDSIIIDQTDRRYCILKTNAPPHPGRNSYYGPLFDWTRTNSPALLHFLKEFDLSSFQPKAHAPMTVGKRALVLQSMMPLDSFIYDHVETKEWPLRWDILTPSSLVQSLNQFNLRATPKEVANAFARLGYLELGRIRAGEDGDKIRMWAVRNFDDYRGMSAAQLRQIWMSQINGDPRTGDDSVADSLMKFKPADSLMEEQSM